MPRKKSTYALTSQGIPAQSAHPESPESRKKSNRKYQISSYGLAQEQFDRLLDAQRTCGMCHEPFEKGQLIHMDHLTMKGPYGEATATSGFNSSVLAPANRYPPCGPSSTRMRRRAAAVVQI